MIVLDTSAIIALSDSSDPEHGPAVEVVNQLGGPLMVPAFLMSEATYMLDAKLGQSAVTNLISSVIVGDVQIDNDLAGLVRILHLIERYSDMSLGFADASVIECAERTKATVLTFDSDFHVVAREKTFSALPPMTIG